jgi:nucleoside 2-deoxyribosyltransferase
MTSSIKVYLASPLGFSSEHDPYREKVKEDGIREADVVFAILDGAEVDSGTASEVGFGSALGKRCNGLRTDIRDSGDFHGVPLNLQVLHFIERTGGKLFRRTEDIVIGRGKDIVQGLDKDGGET